MQCHDLLVSVGVCDEFRVVPKPTFRMFAKRTLVDDFLDRRRLSRRLGSMRLPDRLARMLFGPLHLGQPFLDRVLRGNFLRGVLEHGRRLRVIYGWRRRGSSRRSGGNRRVIVPMVGALYVRRVLFSQRGHVISDSAAS
jgi:hypothetical protein